MSSEAIRSPYAKKRVNQKVLIAENYPAPLTRSHLIQKDTLVFYWQMVGLGVGVGLGYVFIHV